MSLDLMEIAARAKRWPTDPTAIGDFSLRPAGRIRETELLGSPDWTLYCLDLPSRRALLVELPPGSDLSGAAFVYSQQFATARRAALVPFRDLIAASRRIAPPAGLTFLFSTGRCGSTLASRILAQVPGVWSLSEPDPLTNLAMARLGLAPEELAELVRATTLWTCRPPAGRAPEIIVIKPRSEAVLIADSCRRAFPGSRNVFMYRDHLGYVGSCFRFAQRILGPEAFLAPEAWRPLWDFVMAGLPIGHLDDLFAPDHGPIGWEEFLTLVWDLRIEGYLRALRRGMTFAAIHYDDLDGHRAAETTRLLEACGVSARHLDAAMAAFAEDSHAGSVGANATPARALTPEQRARASRLLALMGRRDYTAERLPESRPGPGPAREP